MISTLSMPGRPGFIDRDMLHVALLSILAFLLAHWQALGHTWMLNDDVRQQVFWMRRWIDPDLFAGHWLLEYARVYVSWGVRGLYRAAALVVDPMLFAKILPGFLFLLLSMAMFSCGRSILDRRLGWILAALCWLSPVFLDRMAGGLARGFGFPLLAFFLAAWLEDNGPLMALSLLLQALFIPYICLLTSGAAMSGFVLGRLGVLPGSTFFSRWWHWVALAVCAGLVVGFSKEIELAGFGPFVDKSDVVGDPVFTAAGRFPIYPVPSFWFELLVKPWLMVFPFKTMGAAGGAPVMALTLVAALWGAKSGGLAKAGRRLVPLAHLLLSSLVLYAAARILLFKLFVPARFFEYSLPLILLVLLGCALHGLWPGREGRRIPSWKAGTAIVFLLLASALFLHNAGIKDYRHRAAVWDELARTDKDSLFAGHPYLMDNVLALSNRPVTVSFELAHPWSKGLWARLEPDLRATLAAYYAKDERVVRGFAREYGVRYFLVDEFHYTEEFLSGNPPQAPFYEAYGYPAWLGKLLAGLGLDMEVPDLRERSELVGRVPLFAPYDEFIRELAGMPGEFALPGGSWPKRELAPGLWLVDVSGSRNTGM